MKQYRWTLWVPIVALSLVIVFAIAMSWWG